MKQSEKFHGLLSRMEQSKGYNRGLTSRWSFSEPNGLLLGTLDPFFCPALLDRLRSGTFSGDSSELASVSGWIRSLWRWIPFWMPLRRPPDLRTGMFAVNWIIPYLQYILEMQYFGNVRNTSSNCLTGSLTDTYDSSPFCDGSLLEERYGPTL